MDFCSLLSWSLRTEHIVTLWTVLELVDSKIWLSFEYKSCSLFNLHVCRVFICYHCYCEIKVMKLRSTSIAAILLKCCLCCRSSELECRTVLLVLCFICMVALMLSFSCNQVVLLRIVLSLLTWPLEKASKCSIVVYKLSLVIWVTSI
jgi:hypothetical protein